jgi:pyrroloquinoline quinone biosynthesis protein B
MIIKVLGSGQDSGIPHIGCRCDICSRAREDSKYKRLGPSVAIIDKSNDFCYLLDASPDFKSQVDMVRDEIGQVKRGGKIPVSGILLTHAHLGHTAGLWHLGREALNEAGIPVFCTPKMAEFLRRNHPFTLLVERGNIDLREVTPDQEFEMDGLRFLAFKVPHRDEVADTVGYVIQASKRIVYVPDLDHWTNEVVEKILEADIALIDGTFYSRDEIVRFEEIPHPPINETLERIGDAKNDVYFTHINHTNPVNRDGSERTLVEKRGFKIARDGMIIEIRDGSGIHP